MSKRSREIKKSKESDALMKLRKSMGLSVRKAADLLGVSHTLVNHLELGRANISPAYVEKFLKTFNYSNEDWYLFLHPSQKNRTAICKKIAEDCAQKMQKLSE